MGFFAAFGRTKEEVQPLADPTHSDDSWLELVAGCCPLAVKEYGNDIDNIHKFFLYNLYIFYR